VIAAPQVQRAGVRTPALVELLDLYPTLVDLCGLPPVVGLEGVSLRPLLANPAANVKEAAFTQAPRPPRLQGGQSDTMGYSMRDARFRYTEWREWRTGRLQATELYDHERDPDELINRAADPALAASRAAMARRLAAQFPPAALPPQ
jgi:iduronate 2-sulfatase